VPQALGRQRLASPIVAPLGKVREPKAIGFDDDEDCPPVFRLIGIRCARYACLLLAPRGCVRRRRRRALWAS